METHSHYYYILGYLIVLTSHNWPLFIALGCALVAAWQLYFDPTKQRVEWLYGWSLLVFAYEYAKHLGNELARPVEFLFTTDWAWMVPAGVTLVAIVPVPLILLAALVMLFRALGRAPIRFQRIQQPAR